MPSCRSKDAGESCEPVPRVGRRRLVVHPLLQKGIDLVFVVDRGAGTLVIVDPDGGSIDSPVYEFSSVLRFIENLHGLHLDLAGSGLLDLIVMFFALGAFWVRGRGQSAPRA